MSILLDALRKSEKDQQKFEAPDIHSGEPTKSTSGFFRKGWLLLLIVGVFAISSSAWYQFQQSEETYEPTAILASAVNSTEKQRSSKPTGKADSGKRTAAVANATDKKARTPVEAYQKAAGTDTQTRPGVNGKTKSAQSAGQVKPAGGVGNKKPVAKKQASNDQTASQKTVNKQAKAKSVNKKAVNKQTAITKSANKQTTKPQTSKKQASNKQAVSQKANGKSSAKKSKTAKSVETSQKPFRPQPPAPISYWELPDAVRAKIPEMKFTVLVYAKDPADRFVLINGQRYGQGEQVQSDLFVREIRRKGVVFKYRLYKFLVER